ncbi:hypothetical protein MBLNU459_g4377t1 [Dothideomycetes sp. NU459]
MNTHIPRRAFQRICAQRQPLAPPPSPTTAFLSPSSRRCLHRHAAAAAAPPPPLLRTSALATTARHARQSVTQKQQQQQQRRHESSARPLTDRADQAPEPQPKDEQPAYEMTFTCRKCLERSSHRISKQGYHHGTILITCPGCKNRHLISDHLKIFSDTSVTIEDILKEKGQLLKKGQLGSEGDVEFWDDGTQTERKEPGE